MTITRSIKPVGGNDITFSLPQIEKFNLENGLTVYLVKKDNLPVLNINLILDAGTKYDPTGKKGLVNLHPFPGQDADVDFGFGVEKAHTEKSLAVILDLHEFAVCWLMR